MNDNNEQKEERRKRVYQFVAVLAVGAVGLGYVEVPPWIIDVATGFFVAGAVGWIVGGEIYSWIHTAPEPVRMAHLDAAGDVANKWYLPPEWWENREYAEDCDGSEYLIDADTYAVRDYEFVTDGDRGKVIIKEGVAQSKIEESTDLELMTWRNAVYETRGKLRTRARLAKWLEMNFPSLVDGMEHRYWVAMRDKELDDKAEFGDIISDELDAEIGDMRDELRLGEDEVEDQIIEEIKRDYGGEIPDELHNYTDESGGDSEKSTDNNAASGNRLEQQQTEYGEAYRSYYK